MKTDVWNKSWHSIYLSAALMLLFWLFYNCVKTCLVKTTDYVWSIEETVIFVKMTKVENITLILGKKKNAAEFYNLQRFATWNAHLWQTLVFYFGAGLLCSLQPVIFWPSCKLVYLLLFCFTFSFTLSLKSNTAGLTKWDFPIGYNFGILLWITSIQVC